MKMNTFVMHAEVSYNFHKMLLSKKCFMNEVLASISEKTF